MKKKKLTEAIQNVAVGNEGGFNFLSALFLFIFFGFFMSYVYSICCQMKTHAAADERSRHTLLSLVSVLLTIKTNGEMWQQMLRRVRRRRVYTKTCHGV